MNTKLGVVYGILLAAPWVVAGQTVESACEREIASGKAALDSGDYAGAERIFAAMVSEREKHGADARLGYILGELGRARIGLGKYSEAARLFRRGIAILEASPEDRSANLAAEWFGLGAALYNQGLFSQAVQPYRAALKLQMSIQPPDWQASASVLSGLAAAYSMQQRYGEAGAALEQALQLDNRNPESDLTVRLILLNDLGTLYGKEGLHERAESAFSEAVGLLSRYHDPDGALTSVLQINLANEYVNRRQYAAAEPLFWRALVRIEQGAPVAPGIVLDLLQRYRNCIQKTATRQAVRAFDTKAALIRNALPEGRTGSLSVDVSQLSNNRQSDAHGRAGQ